jgi:hypothetical protein
MHHVCAILYYGTHFMKYMVLTSTYYTLLVLFELHVCAQAITILYGANVQYPRERALCMITMRSIHLPFNIYLTNVVSVMHVGGHVIPRDKMAAF